MLKDALNEVGEAVGASIGASVGASDGLAVITTVWTFVMVGSVSTRAVVVAVAPFAALLVCRVAVKLPSAIEAPREVVKYSTETSPLSAQEAQLLTNWVVSTVIVRVT